MNDHMESPTDPTRTRCGRDVNHVPNYVFDYGDDAATCKTCRHLYAKDLAEAKQKLKELILDVKWDGLKDVTETKPGLPRRYYKCARTDCGVAGCECSSLDPEPPEFCVYDNDEAHWDEIKRGDDQ